MLPTYTVDEYNRKLPVTEDVHVDRKLYFHVHENMH